MGSEYRHSVEKVTCYSTIVGVCEWSRRWWDEVHPNFGPNCRPHVERRRQRGDPLQRHGVGFGDAVDEPARRLGRRPLAAAAALHHVPQQSHQQVGGSPIVSLIYVFF